MVPGGVSLLTNVSAVSALSTRLYLSLASSPRASSLDAPLLGETDGAVAYHSENFQSATSRDAAAIGGTREGMPRQSKFSLSLPAGSAINLVASCRRSADGAFFEIAVGKGAQSLPRPVEQLERRLLGVVEK